MESIKAESPLVTEELLGQIAGVFQKLEKKVVIKAVLDPREEKGNELGCFLSVLGSIHPLVETVLYKPGEDPETEEYFDLSMLPVCGLFREDGSYAGAAYYGVPGGQETNSLIFAIYNAGSSGQAVDKRVLKKLEKLTKPVHFRTYVTLGCHHCPKMVIACQRLATLSDAITAEMVDAALYPQAQERYHIERVPMTLVNGADPVMGVKPIESIVEIACEYGCEKKRRFF